MEKNTDSLKLFAALVEKHALDDGLHQSAIADLSLYRDSKPHNPEPRVYDPMIIFAAQGRKRVLLDGTAYEYNVGHFLMTLAPIPVACQIIEASPERPMLGVAIRINRQRMLNVLMKMDQLEPARLRPASINASGIFTAPLNDNLLGALIRLLSTLASPAEAAIVGDAIIDEIYFRILKHERGGALTLLLQQHGQIQQIARAVEYVHQNLTQVVSVEELAALVNMSSSGFHKKFKEVMHLSPLQYAKQVKLNVAQTHILEGVGVSEAGYMVGYNSPAQFSREYKRHFGVTPSADRSD